MSYEPKRFDFSIPVRVNLSSDTQTKPSRAMKEAMMEAVVGDALLDGLATHAVRRLLVLSDDSDGNPWTVSRWQPLAAWIRSGYRDLEPPTP